LKDHQCHSTDVREQLMTTRVNLTGRLMTLMTRYLMIIKLECWKWLKLLSNDMKSQTRYDKLLSLVGQYHSNDHLVIQQFLYQPIADETFFDLFN